MIRWLLRLRGRYMCWKHGGCLAVPPLMKVLYAFHFGCWPWQVNIEIEEQDGSAQG